MAVIVKKLLAKKSRKLKPWFTECRVFRSIFQKQIPEIRKLMGIRLAKSARFMKRNGMLFQKVS